MDTTVITGLSRCWAADWQTDGTYKNGKEIGKAIDFSFEPGEAKDNTLYADNSAVASDTTVATAKVTLTTDGLSLENTAFLLGSTVSAATITGVKTTEVKELMIDGANPGYMGYATIARYRVGGIDKYRAILIRKMRFAVPKMTAKTQGESVDWQTNALSGTAYRDTTGANPGFLRSSSDLDTEADALLTIKSWLNITTTGTGA